MECFSNILTEAEICPTKRYVLSCSWVNELDPNKNEKEKELYELINKLGNMQNVLILAARDDPGDISVTTTFGKHPATVEV